MIAAGVLAIGLPLMAGIAVDALVAWLLLVSGALHLAFAWRGHGAAGVLWEVVLGLVYGVIGVYLMAHPLAGLASLTLAVACYLGVEAALEYSCGSTGARRGGGWLLIDGIITLVLAVMIGAMGRRARRGSSARSWASACSSAGSPDWCCH